MLIVEIDRKEWLGLVRADDLVHLSQEPSTRVGRANRHGDDELAWLLSPYCAHRGQHGGPCTQSVVDDDDGPPGNGRFGARATQAFLKAPRLGRLGGDRLVQVR